MIVESGATSESRGREWLDAVEIVAADDGSTAGDDVKRVAEDGLSCCGGTGDSKAFIVDRDDDLPGS